MNLEQQLRSTAERWFAAECLSPERAAQLEGVIKGTARRRPFSKIGAAVAVAAVVAMAVNWPVVISVASETPLVGPFINRMATQDRGALWAKEKGFVVPVDKSATDKGYTFRVDSVAADASRTIVYMTIEGPDLTRSAEPNEIFATFNRFSAPEDGYGAMQWDVVDGRMVGQVDLAPLPHPTALVGIAASDINGVKGDWNLSFMVSRTKLDELTRTVEVNKHLQGDGYDLVVQRVLLAPTETRVEMSGMVADHFELRGIQLLADGKPVVSHGGNWGGHNRGTSTAVHPMKFVLPFERIDVEPKTLTLRLLGVNRRLDGGPVIDLTRPGTRVTYNGVTFALESIVVADGRTEIALAIPGDPSSGYRAWTDFQEWLLVDTSGREYRLKNGTSASDSTTMRLSFEGEVKSPVRLEARQHTEPAAGTVEVSIPLK